MPGARIYNLFPLLVGPIDHWTEHLPRVSEMGFDWLFINPFHNPGFSGSLYAVKDHFRLNPLFLSKTTFPENEQLKSFVRKAGEYGISVMMDLVVNHTAKDSLLVSQHPEWFAREPDGSIRSPFAVDPDDSRKKTVWGDLGEIDYSSGKNLGGLLEYWISLIRFYTDLGFKGFRCDAAYKVPKTVWLEIIGRAKTFSPESLFFAETLGCKIEETLALQGAGFDYFFNSSKWWDFRESWLLKQYETFRHIAPSVSFPESHDTDRLAEETNGNEMVSKFRYLFSAIFSTGIMIPIGFEFGFRRKLNVVHTRPGDWENPTFDISGFIRDANRWKMGVPLFNEEGPEKEVPLPSPLTGLLKTSEVTRDRVLCLINPTGQEHVIQQTDEVIRNTVGSEALEITMGKNGEDWKLRDGIQMAPYGIRVFFKSGK